MEKSYEKISPTAKIVAYLRTFTDIQYSKEIAVESEAEKTFHELTGETAESMVRLVPFWEARYKVTDQIIKEYGMTQILEIAAGLSPRGLAMTRNPDVVYVVTDLPQILEVEKKIAEAIIAKSNSHRLNLHFQAADCLDMENLSSATAPFKSDKPVAIITEGLFPYLNLKEREILAGNIKEVLGKYGGIWITSDVHTKQFMQKISQLDPNVQKRFTRISISTDSALESNVFADDNDKKEFFEKAGFKIEEYPYSKVLENLSSVKILNLNEKEKLVLRYFEVVKTLILTPRDTVRNS